MQQNCQSNEYSIMQRNCQANEYSDTYNWCNYCISHAKQNDAT